MLLQPLWPAAEKATENPAPGALGNEPGDIPGVYLYPRPIPTVPPSSFAPEAATAVWH